MVKTFKILTIGERDPQGDIFLPGSVKVKNAFVPVLDNFQRDKIVGNVISVEEDGKDLMCTADILIEPKGLTPAIGFKPIKSNKSDGTTIYEEIDMYCIGLSNTPNVDPNIKPL